MRSATSAATCFLKKNDSPKSPVSTLPDPEQELRDDRAVESEPRADVDDVLRRRCRAGDDGRGIAGREPQHREHQHRDDRHHGNGREQAAGDVGEHQLIGVQNTAGVQLNRRSRASGNPFFVHRTPMDPLSRGRRPHRRPGAGRGPIKRILAASNANWIPDLATLVRDDVSLSNRRDAARLALGRMRHFPVLVTFQNTVTGAITKPSMFLRTAAG